MAAPVVPQRDTAGWFSHPRGLSTLFFTEMWERFSFYGLKALLILFMTAAVTQGGLGFTDQRAGNVIGGGDWAVDRLVPDVLRALDHSEPVVLRHPEAVRPWQHVLDPLHGYLLLAERVLDPSAEAPAALNFGDCFAYAVAKEHACRLLYVSDDFAKTDIEGVL